MSRVGEGDTLMETCRGADFLERHLSWVIRALQGFRLVDPYNPIYSAEGCFMLMEVKIYHYFKLP